MRLSIPITSVARDEVDFAIISVEVLDKIAQSIENLSLDDAVETEAAELPIADVPGEVLPSPATHSASVQLKAGEIGRQTLFGSKKV